MKFGTGLRTFVLALVLTFAILPQAAHASTQTKWANVSTLLALGLAGGASLATIAHPDAAGRVELIKTFAGTFLGTEALKAAVHERRPDGSGNDSFPSGHTAIAFASATYFDVRYGAEYPRLVPIFYGAAVLTGVARIKAHKHYFKDVAAGALLGWGIAHLFTTEKHAMVSVYPAKGGLIVSYTRRF